MGTLRIQQHNVHHVVRLFDVAEVREAKSEAEDHKEDVEDQGKEMKSTSDPDLKKFASASYDTVSRHKESIDELHRALDGK